MALRHRSARALNDVCRVIAADIGNASPAGQLSDVARTQGVEANGNLACTSVRDLIRHATQIIPQQPLSQSLLVGCPGYRSSLLRGLSSR